MELKKILKLESIDILFTTIIGFDSLIVPFVMVKIPKILEIHNSEYSYNNKTWFFKKRIISLYDKVALLIESEIDYFGLKNVIIIPNFSDNSDVKLLTSTKKYYYNRRKNCSNKTI